MTMLLTWLKADRSRAKALAARVECTPSQLYRIAHGRRRSSIALGLRIQTATDGEVTLADLRPDLAAAFSPTPPDAEARP